MIPFNNPALIGKEEQYMMQSLRSYKISRDGQLRHKYHVWLQKILPYSKALLTTSCMYSLEVAVILIDIQVFQGLSS